MLTLFLMGSTLTLTPNSMISPPATAQSAVCDIFANRSCCGRIENRESIKLIGVIFIERDLDTVCMAPRENCVFAYVAVHEKSISVRDLGMGVYSLGFKILLLIWSEVKLF